MSSSAWLRVVRSEARRVLCRAIDCLALRATVSCSAFLSPRCGTRRLTRLPRSSDSQISSAGRRPAAREPGSPSARPRRPHRRTAAGGSARRGRRGRCPRSSPRPIRAGPGPGRRGRGRSAPPPRAGRPPARSTSASVPSPSTTACFSSARLSAPRSSRSRAAFSKSWAADAAYISRSMRLTNADVCPAMKSQKSSTIAPVLLGADVARRTARRTCRCSRAGRAGRPGRTA